MKDFLAGQYRVLWLFAGIRARGMGLRRGGLNGQLAVLTGLGEDRLAQRQRRGRLIAGVMVGAPQRRIAIKLLEHRQDHSGSIIDRRRVATSIIGQQQLLWLLGTGQKRPNAPSMLSSSNQPKRSNTCCGQAARTLCSMRHRAWPRKPSGTGSSFSL